MKREHPRSCLLSLSRILCEFLNIRFFLWKHNSRTVRLNVHTWKHDYRTDKLKTSDVFKNIIQFNNFPCRFTKKNLTNKLCPNNYKYNKKEISKISRTNRSQVMLCQKCRDLFLFISIYILSKTIQQITQYDTFMQSIFHKDIQFS